MAQAIIYLFASLFIFLILTEIITINFYYGEVIIIDINFMIFAVKFTKRRKQKEDNKNEKKHGRAGKDIFLLFLSSIIRKSDIILHRLDLSLPNKDPAANAIKYGIYTSFISSLLAFAEENSKNFSSDNIIISYSDHNSLKAVIDARIKISLLDIIISVFASIFLTVGRKIVERRAKTNYGRKQNE